MSNNDPKRESELDDFRRALTQQGFTQAPTAPEPSTLDRFRAALGDVAGRSTEWVSGQVHAGLQDLVSRVLLGETVSEPLDKDKHAEQAREQAQERDKGIDR
jgi:hypothetical protein